MEITRFRRLTALLAIARRNPSTRRLPDGAPISDAALRRAFVDLESRAFMARRLGYLRRIPTLLVAPELAET